MAITHIDHVLIAVPDLEEASRQFARLGFHLTGGGVHPGRGTANRLAVLDPEYLELITVTQPEDAWPDLVAFLQQYGSGIYNFALASDDLDADVAAFRQRAAEGLTDLRLEEPWDGALVTPGGRRRGWRAASVRGGGATHPFLVQHDSTGAEKLARLAGDGELKPHPAGYVSISRISVAFPTLEQGVAYFREGYGLQPAGEPSVCRARQADRVFFPLEYGAIEVLAPQSPESPVARLVAERGSGVEGLVLTVPDTAAAAARLARAGIAVERRSSGLVVVDPKDALGVNLRLSSGPAVPSV